MKTAVRIKTVESVGRYRGTATAVRYGILFLLAMLSCNARIIGGLTGMGVALSASLPKKDSFAAAAGSLFGYYLFATAADRMVLLPATLILVCIKLLTPFSVERRATPLLQGVVSFFIMLCCGIGASFVSRVSTMDLIFRVLQAVLCFAVTFFSSTAVRAFFSSKNFRHYSVKEFVSIAVLADVFLLSLCDIRLFTFSAGRILGILVVMCFMPSGSFVSVGVGAGAAVAFALYSPDFAPYCGALLIGSVLACALRPIGKFGQLAVFLTVNTAVSLLISTGQHSIAYLLDSFLASAVFAAIPSRFLKNGITAVGVPAEDVGQSVIKTSGWFAARLRFAAHAIHDLRSSIDLVSDKMQNPVPDISSVYHRSAEQICRNCGLKLFCWETQYETTWDALQSVTELLKKNGRVERDEMPSYFKNKCCKSEPFTAAVNQNYQSFLSYKQASRMANEAKQISSEQLDGVADMLREIGEQFGSVVSVNPRQTDKLKAMLKNLDVQAEDAFCYEEDSGRMLAEIYLNSPLNVPETQICENLTSVLDRDFDLPSVTQIDEKIKLCFFEMARYHTEFCVEQIPATGEQRCGDSFDSFSDSKGYFHLVLSDGMGSGPKAALDSVMACSFLLKLIKAGFGFESAIKLVNSTLLIKTADETLATLDVLRIDLYTGKAEFLKAGAAPSFVQKGSTVEMLSSDSLPVGILKGIGFDRQATKLSAGDVILLVSDGVTCTGTEWVASELELLNKKEVNEIAKKISNEAKRRRIDGHADDITVIAIRVKSD